MKIKHIFICTLLSLVTTSLAGSCDDDKDDVTIVRDYSEQDNVDVPHKALPDFAYGADPSWVTAMEAADWKFYDTDGQATDCFELLSNTVGVNACRLRVWVNPSNGWCNTNDVVKKAQRAQSAGQNIMIDFHYSDEWADPSKQKKPSIWDDCQSLDEMTDLLYKYTKKVLTALKTNGVDVSWVQIGNETQNGMLETNSDGAATSVSGWMGPDYCKLHNAGAKACKEVYPECLIVVHFQNGQNEAKNINSLEKLKAGGAEYDVFGVSLYPDFTKDTWYEDYIDACMHTLSTVKTTYGKDVMICEVGCTDITTENARIALNDVVYRCQHEVDAKGVFFWEPECYNSWEGYKMGGFLSNGRPSDALIGAFGGRATSRLHD